jgi:hypothetical protein
MPWFVSYRCFRYRICLNAVRDEDRKDRRGNREEFFHALSRPVEYADGIEPSCLYVLLQQFENIAQTTHKRFPLKAEVEGHDYSQLNMLKSPP